MSAVVDIANALIKLRNTSSQQIAEIAGVNHENLRHFLNKNKVPIQYDSVRSMFTALGVISGRFAKIVHNWEVKGGAFKKQEEVYAPISNMIPMVKNGRLVQVNTPKVKGMTIYLLSTEHGACIVILDKHGPLRSSKVSQYLSLNVEKNVNVVIQVWDMIINHDIAMTEFDMVSDGDGTLSGWKQVRIVAREYGVSPKEIVDWAVMQRGQRQMKEFKLQLIEMHKPAAAQIEESEVVEKKVEDTIENTVESPITNNVAELPINEKTFSSILKNIKNNENSYEPKMASNQ